MIELKEGFLPTMRIYEFAKKCGLPSKDLIALLTKHGFEASSHMSVLSDAAISLLNNELLPKKDSLDAITEKKDASVLTVKKEQQIEVEVSKPAAVKEKEVSVQAQKKPEPLQEGIAFPKKVSEKKEFGKEAPSELIKISLAPQTVSDFAQSAKKMSSEIILTLLKWGILSSKNQLITQDLVARLAEHYGLEAVKPVEKIKEETKAANLYDVQKENLQERLPVVVVMGHVDHGKTTLLDYIRKTRVAAKEKGGITQHLGAYEAITSQGNVVFIDTPGHEAFSKIRVRGTKVADIVILVVAADDGVMPQTIEALKHAQAMNVPIIVAINKIDKVEKTRIDVVKRDLASTHNLLPEEWGGQTIYIPISAKTGIGVDSLLDMIILQSKIMELKAEHIGTARGFILESKIEKGRGPVATVLTQHGLLKVGDYFVAGKTAGKINSMVDSFGSRISEVGPSHPVQVAGFDDLPGAGDLFEVVNKDLYLKTKNIQAGTKPQISARAVQGESDIKLIVKTDTNSSQEALIDSIFKISKKSEKKFNILNSGIGNITESDVMLANDTGARIVALHIKLEANASSLAARLGVTIHSFDIIYKLLEYLEEFSASLATVKMIRTKVGEALVRKVFDIKNVGMIAGCYCKQGLFVRDGMVTVWRNSKKITEGKISSLQRDKNTVKEVHTGFEFAFMIEGFRDWQIDDRIECFVEKPELKK